MKMKLAEGRKFTWEIHPMYRGATYLVIGLLVTGSAGCCWRPHCCESSGWTTSNSNGSIANQPYRLMGNTKPISEGCYDAVTGAPVPCPPPNSTMVIPGGYPVGPMPQPMQPPLAPSPNVLPFPGETIPPAGIPNAQPFPAPGVGSNLNSTTAQPVKNVQNK